MGPIFYRRLQHLQTEHEAILYMSCYWYLEEYICSKYDWNQLEYTCSWKVWTHQHASTLTSHSHTLIEWFSARSSHEIRLSYQTLRLLVPLTKPSYLASFSKQNALFSKPCVHAWSTTSLIFDRVYSRKTVPLAQPVKPVCVIGGIASRDFVYQAMCRQSTITTVTATVDSWDAEVSFAGSFEGAEWVGEEKEGNVRHRGAEAYLFEIEYTEDRKSC